MNYQQPDQESSRASGLTGRRAIVTGASSGIGCATARALLAAGATVIAVGRRAERLRELLPVAAVANPPTLVSGDLKDSRFREALCKDAGDVDILINAAGVLQHTPFLEGDPAAWEDMWQTNVQSMICLTQLVARKMALRKSGHIVNLSSILASRVYPYTAVYAATKYATRALSQGMRMELHQHGIKVTEIAPGLVKTEILRELRHPDVVEAYKNRTYAPLVPEQVAKAILDVLSSEGNACVDLVEINPAGQA